MERHCRIHGNYGFFLGSSGGCPGCKSDRAQAQRERKQAREQANWDRRRAREEADTARYQANLARERSREDAQNRRREQEEARERRHREKVSSNPDRQMRELRQRMDLEAYYAAQNERAKSPAVPVQQEQKAVAATQAKAEPEGTTFAEHEWRENDPSLEKSYQLQREELARQAAEAQARRERDERALAQAQSAQPAPVSTTRSVAAALMASGLVALIVLPVVGPIFAIIVAAPVFLHILTDD